MVEDLAEKMVFIAGPRQGGKTTLARELISDHFTHAAYFNWDNRKNRRAIMQGNWPGDAEILISDEIYK